MAWAVYPSQGIDKTSVSVITSAISLLEKIQQMKSSLLLLTLTLALTCAGSERHKESLTVRAVSHDSRTNEFSWTYTTPGSSSTDCSGSGTTYGNTTRVSTNCKTSSTPAQTHLMTRQTIDVMNLVEGNGLRYTITCRASWGGSNCSPMVDGDVFPAEIDGHTMWISARRGGNQGKAIRVKYKILNIDGQGTGLSENEQIRRAEQIYHIGESAAPKQ